MAEGEDALVELARQELGPNEFAEALPVLKKADAIQLEGELTSELPKGAAVAEEKQVDIRTQIGRMGVPQKIKAAMFGNAIVRRLLIFDPSRLVQECVLDNPTGIVTIGHPTMPAEGTRYIHTVRQHRQHTRVLFLEKSSAPLYISGTCQRKGPRTITTQRTSHVMVLFFTTVYI